MVILGFDIPAALIPDVSLFETIARGVIMYLVIFVLLRTILRGRTSAVTISDLLVIVLIADAAQNAMAAQYNTLTNGIVLVATIITCSFVVDWIAYHVPSVERFVHPDRKPLIVDGRMIRRTMRAELITDDELETQLRLNGVEEVADVKAAYLEGNGAISVIKRKGGGDGGRKAEASAGAG